MWSVNYFACAADLVCSHRGLPDSKKRVANLFPEGVDLRSVVGPGGLECRRVGPLGPRDKEGAVLPVRRQQGSFLLMAAKANDQMSHISGSPAGFPDRSNGVLPRPTDTKMTITAERLAVIAVLTLPVTALPSVVGMDVIVNYCTPWIPLAMLLAIMFTISLIRLRWAKRQGWW